METQVQADRVEQEAEEEHDPIKIVRRKTLSVKPMTAEEAVLQMEMLGHNFFIFEDAESGKGALVYARRKGSYGLIAIEDELEEA